MKTRCSYCHTYRIIEEGTRRLENEDETGMVCLDCEEWLEQETRNEEQDWDNYNY